jgi:hypothetical protein
MSHIAETELSFETLFLPGLQRAFHWLSCRLECAAASVATADGAGQATAPYRGLYVSNDDVVRILARDPGSPVLWGEAEDVAPPLPESISDDNPFCALKSIVELSSFDLAALIVALAPEFDVGYERVYAYLQDDVTRKRPTVDLVLNLLCASIEEKLARHAHFASNAPLRQYGLLHLIPDPQNSHSPLLAHFLKVDVQIASMLLGHTDMDSRLASFCRIIEPLPTLPDSALPPDIAAAIAAILDDCQRASSPFSVYFQRLPGKQWLSLSNALANASSARVLAVDLARAPAAAGDFESSLTVAFREALFRGAVLFIDGIDSLRNSESDIRWRSLLDALDKNQGIAFLAGDQPWLPTGSLPGVLCIPLAVPEYSERRCCWQSHLKAAQIPLSEQDVDSLASRFALTSAEVAAAVAMAKSCSRWQRAVGDNSECQISGPRRPGLADLFAAARAQCGPVLQALARKVEPRYTWDDIILPPDALAQLQEVCAQAKYRHIVYDRWGFDRKLSLGKDLTVLFSGHPGTGKTMAAEVIAYELGLDLYKIDLSRVVSKYIGETEKSLDRIFDAAERANVVLFFDEADSLFGKRSQVKDAHDRYANIEIGYLLQKMEEYEGIAILATNLRTNMDEAFLRRLKFHVELPFPEEEYRYRIWDGMFSTEAPRDPNLDVRFLARQFKIAGGAIKNIVLNAAFMAASEDRSIGMEHVMRAAKREFQKMGKTCSAAEFGEYFSVVK